MTVAERQDAVEDLTAEMATAALEIMLQEFKIEEVKQVVGEGAVWPELTDKEAIFRQVRISVRAGSTTSMAAPIPWIFAETARQPAASGTFPVAARAAGGGTGSWTRRRRFMSRPTIRCPGVCADLR